MASKQAGDLYRMLLDMEQESQSTCRTLDPRGTTTNKGPDSLVASGPVSFGKNLLNIK